MLIQIQTEATLEDLLCRTSNRIIKTHILSRLLSSNITSRPHANLSISSSKILTHQLISSKPSIVNRLHLCMGNKPLSNMVNSLPSNMVNNHHQEEASNCRSITNRMPYMATPLWVKKTLTDKHLPPPTISEQEVRAPNSGEKKLKTYDKINY